MEAFLKGIYQGIAKAIFSLWAYRLICFIHLICITLCLSIVSHFSKVFDGIDIVPHEYKLVLPIQLSIFAGITFAEILIRCTHAFYKRLFLWKNLTLEEIDFIKTYISSNTKTQYVVANNGTWRNSGTIQLLRSKEIIYLASTLPEYRGEHYMAMDQTFPFNIHNDALKYFKKAKL